MPDVELAINVDYVSVSKMSCTRRFICGCFFANAVHTIAHCFLLCFYYTPHQNYIIPSVAVVFSFQKRGSRKIEYLVSMRKEQRGDIKMAAVLLSDRLSLLRGDNKFYNILYVIYLQPTP